MKKIKLLLLTTLMAVVLVSCGSPKYIGSWKLSSVNGMSVADYIAQYNLNIADFSSDYFDMNLEVTKKDVTVTTAKEKSTLDISLKSDGFETIKDNEVVFSVSFDENADTLSYTVNLGDEGKVTYTYSRK